MKCRNNLHTEIYRGLRIRIDHDQDCGSPREYDNLGTIATWHSRYKLGDVQPGITPAEYLKTLPTGSIVLPVFMYEHSGIALSCGPFACPWDSGQLGVISITPEKIRREYSVRHILKKLRIQVTASLRSEVEEYSKFVNGECYSFAIEDPDGETIDSCCGFIGWEYVQQEARSVVNDILSRREVARAEERERFDDA